MVQESDKVAQAVFSNLRLCLNMIQDALTASGKTEWKRGTKIPLILHSRCKRRFWRKRVATGQHKEPAWLVISRDQTTISTTDLVRCHCSACGKRFRLNAGYLEALLLLSDQADYLNNA